MRPRDLAIEALIVVVRVVTAPVRYAWAAVALVHVVVRERRLVRRLRWAERVRAQRNGGVGATGHEDSVGAAAGPRESEAT
jgi:hypothetical protein